ncbi:hypothetical protein ACF081_01795 [Streptomyces longwoodensis]|uniref:hypothetical protein n=1 Tax=Streptomyces longwoodensis TaxID=68231 RepID=UPI0036F94435
MKTSPGHEVPYDAGQITDAVLRRVTQAERALELQFRQRQGWGVQGWAPLR